MIPERDKGIRTESTVTGENVRMSIDESALSHIMGILTELYADPELAVIREYATNALDSHVEAGIDRPIEISTPTDLRPVFQVRDFGVGLDADDIRAIYSQYGASTKRATNDAVGMLGLGCKSALAYADQFTLRAIKAGEQIIVNVARDDEGAGTMTVLDRGTTDDEDGVEVTIPAPRSNDLADKAATFFSHWAPGTVLVDGEAPAGLDGYELTPELTVDDDPEGGYADTRHVVVMGNVPYPAALDVKLPARKRLIARVPIGSVQFAPSREALMDTPATRKTLRQIEGAFATASEAAVQRDVDKAGTRGEALAAMVASCDALGLRVECQWRGQDVPHEVRRPDGIKLRHVPPAKGWGPRNASSELGAVNMNVAARATWIVGYSNANWTKATREKLMAYMAAEHDEAAAERLDYVLTGGAEPPLREWFTEARVIDWADVKAWRDPDAPKSTGGGPGKYAGTYPTWHPGAGGISGGHNFTREYAAEALAEVEAGKLFYVVGLLRGHGSGPSRLLRERIDPGAVLVEVSRPRAEKFRRLFPEAQEIGEALDAEAKAWWDGLSERERKACHPNLRYKEQIISLPPARVNDPRLRELVELALLHKKVGAGYTDRQNRLNGSRPPSYAVDKIVEKYPLLPGYGRVRGKQIEHAVLYVNAVYEAAEQKGS